MKDVLFYTITIRSRVIKATSGTVPYCTVLGLDEVGAVSYYTELERIGTLTTISDICDLLTVGRESKSDLLTGVGNFK